MIPSLGNGLPFKMGANYQIKQCCQRGQLFDSPFPIDDKPLGRSCMPYGKPGMIAANQARTGRVTMNKLFLVVALVFVAPANTPAQAPFYQDKTLKIVAGYGAGSVDDAWTRLIGRYLGKYIPGNPN